MTSPDFDRSHAVTKVWEGGWSDQPADPGGATMGGITQGRYDEYRDSKGLARRSVKRITLTEALDIFYRGYWLAAGCEDLFTGVDLAVYDASVNSGVSRGRKWLAASLGSSDHSETVKRICAKRLGFVQSLKIFTTFGKGWSRRIADVQAKGVAWALTAMHGPVAAKTMVEDEASAKAKTARAQTQAGATTGAATGVGTGDIVVNPDHVGQLGDFVTYGLIAVGVLVVGVLIVKAIQNRQQADAYAVETGKINA